MRVWLPDRPGALGQVASRIGAVQGDVIGIDILERGGGSAIDELTVRLPRHDLQDLLVAEIRQVDGVAVEDVRTVRPDRPDTSTAGMLAAARLLEQCPDQRIEQLAVELRTLVDGDWTAIVRLDGDDVVATDGEPPDLAWLHSFLSGSRHLAGGAETLPGDMVWAYLDRHGLAAAGGRGDRPFHDRERTQVALLARILDAVA